MVIFEIFKNCAFKSTTYLESAIICALFKGLSDSVYRTLRTKIILLAQILGSGSPDGVLSLPLVPSFLRRV